MEGLGNFLKRFEGLDIPRRKTRECLAEILEDEIGRVFPIKDIVIKGSTAFIRCGSAVKSEIFLKKEKILGLLKSSGESLSDIK